jgi:CRP-like cAMP-binding protein
MTITTSFSQPPSSDRLTVSRNGLLARLSPDDFDLLSAHLTETRLIQGDVLHECGQPIKRVYFPSGGLISLLATVPEGYAIDTVMIGREGAIGLAAGIGALNAWSRAVVQLPGHALQMSAVRLAELAERSKSLRKMIACYQDTLLAQVQQTGVCNTVHPIQARLCRWLLQARDRAATDDLALTQEFLSGVLGVQRTTITLVSRILQSEGILRVRRGHIHIGDVAALERKACACHRISRQLTDQIGCG